MDGTKSNTVVDYAYHLAEIEKKDTEIAELRRIVELGCQNENQMCPYLQENTRLTAALNDDERAERVVATKPHWNNSYNLGRIEGINDYRAMLKEVLQQQNQNGGDYRTYPEGSGVSLSRDGDSTPEPA